MSLNPFEEPDPDMAQYSELLAEYHNSLLSGQSDGFAPSDVDNLSGVFDCLKMMERNRQLQASDVDSSEIAHAREDSDDKHSTLPGSVDDTVDRTKSLGMIGRFKVKRKLGAGGNGVVLLAEDSSNGQELALKVPLPSALLRDDFVERFQREARVATKLKHNHIVPVLEAGSIGPIHYIATEYCDGPTLSKWLSDHELESISPRNAANLISRLASAVQHAHSRGILHRDIKPSNILFQSGKSSVFGQQDLAESVRLADFGLARNPNDSAHLTVTGAGSILGTPAYMSPEQAGGELPDIGTHSDIFSIGVVFYELLTRISPFSREAPLLTLDAVRRSNPTSPSVLNDSIPRDLSAICLKCLQKLPRDRYSSAAALGEDLDRFLDGQPVHARPISTMARVSRWAIRNPAFSSVLLLCGLGIIGSSLALYINRNRTLDALQEAVDARKASDENEKIALRAVFEARMSEVDALQLTLRQGQRVESLKSIERAIPLVDQLELGPETTVGLRAKAIKAVSLLDLEREQNWFGRQTNIGNSNCNQFASMTDDGVVSIHDANDNTVVQTVELPSELHAIGGLLFSPDDRYLAMRCTDTSEKRFVVIWDAANSKIAVRIPNAEFDVNPVGETIYAPYDFHPDGNSIAIVSQNRVRILDLTNGHETAKATHKQKMFCVKFSPDGQKLAVGTTREALVLDAARLNFTKPLYRFQGRRVLVTALGWTGDSFGLAIGSVVGEVVTVNTATKAIRDNGAHGSAITAVAIHPTNGLALVSSLDGITRMGTYFDRSMLVELRCNATHFTRKGDGIATRNGRLKIHTPSFSLAPAKFMTRPIAASKAQIPIEDAASVEESFSVHPDRSLCVRASGGRIAIWDLFNLTEVAQKKLRYSWPGFVANGTQLVARTPQYFVRRSVKCERSETQTTYTIGSEQKIEEKSERPSDLADPTNANFRVAHASGSRAFYFDMNSGELFTIAATKHRFQNAQISRDGSTIVFSFADDGIEIHDAIHQKLLAKLDTGGGLARLSPNGKLLAVTDRGACRFFEPTDGSRTEWKEIRSYPTACSNTGIPAAFSFDGKFIAVRGDQQDIVLLESNTFEPFAKLPLPNSKQVEYMRFTDDYRYFVADNRVSPSMIWDLKKIGTELDQLNLSWPINTVPHKETSRLPIKVIWSD